MGGESLGIELLQWQLNMPRWNPNQFHVVPMEAQEEWEAKRELKVEWNLTSAAAVSILSLNTLPVATNLKCPVWLVYLVLVPALVKDLPQLNGNLSIHYQHV